MYPSASSVSKGRPSTPRSRSPEIMEGVDKTVEEKPIGLSSPKISKDQAAISITNAEMLSSFNWVQTDDNGPTIAVPGHPPRWAPQVPSHRLPTDKESFSQRTPIPLYRHAFEPLLASLAICRPAFDISEIDVVTQLNNLKQLFRCARGDWNNEFRIDIELIGNTIFMSRWGNDITLANGTQSDVSCGHVFQEHMTSYCKDLREMRANSHHRVIRYNLQGLQMVVQHEVDTYTCDCHALECEKETPQADDEEEGQSPSKPPPFPDPNGPLRVLRHGSPHDLLDAPCIAEIKTRKVKSHNKRTDQTYSQLWFSHCRNMLFGYHIDRTFTKVTQDPEDRYNDLQRWQETRQESIRAVIHLLKDVVQSIRSNPNERWGASKKFALLRDPEEPRGSLKLHQLREDYRRNMLPPKR